MGQNVTMFGDVADSYDELVAYNEQIMDEWVESTGYSMGAMVVASGVLALEQFAKGFVDAGRLGNGVLLEGGWRGYGKDALRVLNIAGTASGASALMGRVNGVFRTVQVAGQNTCTWVTAVNAIRTTGQKFFITLEELAAEAGVSLPKIAVTGTDLLQYYRLEGALQRLGVAYRELSPPLSTDLEEISRLAGANRGGVVTFSIKPATGIGHELYATFSRISGLVIEDPLGKTYRSIAQLRAAYPGYAFRTDMPVLFIPNSVLVSASQVVQNASALSMIGFQVVPVKTVLAGDPETAAQVLEVSRQTKTAPGQAPGESSGVFSFPTMIFHKVSSGESLSKIALRFYRNMHKWPIIYEANRKSPENPNGLGNNPNLIYPGQVLWIPELPNVVPGH